MEEVNAAPVPSQPSKGGKGIKVILIVVAVLVVVLGGGLFAYGKFVKNANSISEVFTPIKFNASCKYNDPNLCKFINNWKDIKYFTMIANSTDKDGKTAKWTLKSEGKDKRQMISEENGKENYNYISIANTSYTKDYTDDKWFKFTSNSNSNIQTGSEIDTAFSDKADDAQDKTTYKKIGEEACAKLTCFKYQIIDPAVTDSTEYIYFDNKEYLLRKTRSEGKDGSIIESSFDYSKISITEPSPTKEGDPYSAISNSTAEEINRQLNSNLNSSYAAPAADPTVNTNTDVPAEVPYGDESETPIE